MHEEFLTTLRFWADRGVDGYRVDVAHALAKDLSEPLRSKPETPGVLPTDGSDPLFDRDEVHEIYAEWRAVFEEYDPPRTAVAEAFSAPERRALYARPTGLGQAFNFDLLKADFDAAEFREVVEFCLAQAATVGSSSTWVLSNHDVVRHATRYGLPAGTDLDAWLMTDGLGIELDEAQGLRRARAAVLFMLALPGSAYLYQGEELGLHEVADLPGRGAAGPDLAAHAEHEEGPRRRPRPAAVDGRGGDVRLRFREQLAPAAGGLVAHGGGPPGRRRGLDAGALPFRAADAAGAADRGDAGVRRDRPRGRRALRPPRTAGTASRPSAPSRTRCPPACVRVASAPVTDGLLPGESSAWLTDRPQG